MRVYVAAPWIHKADAWTMAEHLQARGFTITKPWWEHADVNPISVAPNGGFIYDEAADAEMELQAREDYDGVATADAVVVLNLAKSEGKAVEQGIAIALGKPLFILDPYGSKLNVFQHLKAARGVAHFKTTAALVSELERYREFIHEQGAYEAGG